MQIGLKLAEKAQWGVGEPVPKEKRAFLEDGVSAASGSKAPDAIGNGRRILVVDDNPIVLKAFELKLRANGFTVATILNAVEVANAAEQAAAELIILDINFHSMDGLEWDGYKSMQWLRRFPKLAGIPVILISGEDSKQHKERSLAAGAAAFFQKPVSFPELLAVMLRVLGIPA